MKKFFVLSLLVLSMIFFVSCGGSSKKEDKENGKSDTEQNGGSDSGDSGESGNSGDSGDPDNSGDLGNHGDSDNSGESGSSDNSGESGSGQAEDHTVDENLVEVPADQDNTENAVCNPETFVQFCDGNSLVFCGSQEEGKWIVIKWQCEGKTPVCFTYAYGEEERWNTADCYASCDNENEGPGENCASSDSGYTFEYERYTCIKTSKGKLKFIEETKYCDSACSEDGKTCEIKECNPAEDKAYCDENGVLHECADWVGMEIASFCERSDVADMVCRYIEDEDRFGCASEPVE